LWVPIWYPVNTFVVNGYDPTCFWKGNKYVSQSQLSGEFVEVMHVPDDDQNFYTVFGTWFYVVRGTGVWFEAGPRILTTQNKLFALRELGLSTWEMSNLFQDAQFMINDITTAPSISQLATQLGMKGESSNDQVRNLFEEYFKKMEELIRSPHLRLDQAELAKLYLMDRMNNSADFDETTNFLARTQGYDSVQFITQANGNGGWAHELVFVNQEMFLGTDEKRMETLTNRLFIANPLDEYQRERCVFDNDDLYGCLSCMQQPVIWQFCNSSSSLPAPSSPS
jgi:hypothetical protein